MASLTIRNLDPAVKDHLRVRAAERGRSMEEEAAEKLIHLAIREHEKTTRGVRGGLTAVDRFAIMFDHRFKPLGG